VSRLLEAWIWYHHVIGVIAVNCGYLVANGNRRNYDYRYLVPYPRNGSATQPFPGILADVVDLEAVADNDGGYLAIRHLGLG